MSTEEPPRRDPIRKLGALIRLPAAYRQAKDDRLITVVSDLTTKREMLEVSCREIHAHLAAFHARYQRPYVPEPRITLIDVVPERRFQLGLESITNAMYSMCEVAAHLVWTIEQQVPRSFHQLVDRIEQARVEPYISLRRELGSLDWYHNFREIRTEWTHHSPSFIGPRGDGPPLIIVRARRRKKDQVVAQGERHITVADLTTLAERAAEAMQGIALFVLASLVRRIDVNETVEDIVRDENGWPKFQPNGGFVMHTLRMGDELERLGLLARQGPR